MPQSTPSDTWEHGNPYDDYMGRWSRRLASVFLSWLGVPPGRRWLEIGCGTGALSAAIVEQGAPASLICTDPSEGFLATAAQHVRGPVRFQQGSATAIGLPDHSVDVVVSGLVLNFVGDVAAALEEMRRVTAPGGTVAAYVWDYAQGMEMLRIFWDTASALDPAAARLHEGQRFPLCHPQALRGAFECGALVEVEVEALEVATGFASFEDFWRPFLGGQGPAPAYVMSLSQLVRDRLRDRLRSELPIGDDGTIRLHARAWAVRGTVPGASSA